MNGSATNLDVRKTLTPFRTLLPVLDYHSPCLVEMPSSRATRWAITGLLCLLAALTIILWIQPIAQGYSSLSEIGAVLIGLMGLVLLAICGVVGVYLVIVELRELRNKPLRSLTALVLGSLELYGCAVILCGRTTRHTACARESQARTDIANIEFALDQFQVDSGRFPLTEEATNALFSAPPGLQNWKGPYLKKLPLDPWGRPYVYRCPGLHHNDYDLFSLGADGVVGNDDIDNWSGTPAP